MNEQVKITVKNMVDKLLFDCKEQRKRWNEYLQYTYGKNEKEIKLTDFEEMLLDIDYGDITYDTIYTIVLIVKNNTFGVYNVSINVPNIYTMEHTYNEILSNIEKTNIIEVFNQYGTCNTNIPLNSTYWKLKRIIKICDEDTYGDYNIRIVSTLNTDTTKTHFVEIVDDGIFDIPNSVMNTNPIEIFNQIYMHRKLLYIHNGEVY